MKKINAAKYNFTSLDAVIRKKLANRRFRASFAEEMNRLRLAREIKALREKRKMTQQEVAEEANMPQSVVARIESGTHSFSISTLHKIAGVFDKRVGLVGQTQDRR